MATEKDYKFSLENLFRPRVLKHNTAKNVLVRFLGNLRYKVLVRNKFHLSLLQRILLLISKDQIVKVTVLWMGQAGRGQLQKLRKHRDMALVGK